jgi:hypothetical protein
LESAFGRYCGRIRLSSRSVTVAPPGVKERRFVQRESTATGADLPGLVGTLWDGDLRGQTLVDCLPAGLVQQQNTATQQDDVPVHEPGSGSSTGRGCWHDLLKPHAKTNSERLTRKNVPFPTPLTLALVPVRGAFQQMTLAAVATGQASSTIAGPSACRLACLPAAALVAQPGAPGVPAQDAAPVSGAFPIGASFHLLEIRVQAIQL